MIDIIDKREKNTTALKNVLVGMFFMYNGKLGYKVTTLTGERKYFDVESGQAKSLDPDEQVEPLRVEIHLK